MKRGDLCHFSRFLKTFDSCKTDPWCGDWTKTAHVTHSLKLIHWLAFGIAFSGKLARNISLKYVIVKLAKIQIDITIKCQRKGKSNPLAKVTSYDFYLIRSERKPAHVLCSRGIKLLVGT